MKIAGRAIFAFVPTWTARVPDVSALAAAPMMIAHSEIAPFNLLVDAPGSWPSSVDQNVTRAGQTQIVRMDNVDLQSGEIRLRAAWTGLRSSLNDRWSHPIRYPRISF